MNSRRILFVSTTEPGDRSYGGALRNGMLLQALQDCGDVTTLVMRPGNTHKVVEHADPTRLPSITFHHKFRPWPSENSRIVRRMVAQALKGREFDLVVVRYVLLGLYVRPCVAASFILDADDLSIRHSKESAPPLKRALAACRRAARDTVARLHLPRYEHVWFVNYADMKVFRVKSGSMIPNVVDPVSQVRVAQPRSPTVLFVGNVEYGPNIQAVDYFLTHGWPALSRSLPDAKLRIVGKRSGGNAARWNSVPGVESPGFVDDLAAEYGKASVVIAPVFSGGGTQIKVLEALAYGCAAVVSDFVSSGFAPDLLDGQHFVVARTPADWSARCAELIRQPGRAEAIGAAGREAVHRHYSAERVSRSVKDTVKELELRLGWAVEGCR